MLLDNLVIVPPSSLSLFKPLLTLCYKALTFLGAGHWQVHLVPKLCKL